DDGVRVQLALELVVQLLGQRVPGIEQATIRLGELLQPLEEGNVAAARAGNDDLDGLTLAVDAVLQRDTATLQLRVGFEHVKDVAHGSGFLLGIKRWAARSAAGS